MDDMPVYLFTGFLESGKTSFIDETLADKRFNNGHQLYDTGEYSQLADYLVKETEKSFRREDSAVGQRYSSSRNLIQPKKVTRDKPNKSWKRDPKPKPGYYIIRDSIYNGVDRMGYPYQRYLEAKLNPTDADWEIKKTPSGHVTKGTRSHSTSHRPRAGGERSRR